MGEMARTLGFPFTESQLAELKRQEKIYKYMKASVPVPPHLLLPLTHNLSMSHFLFDSNGSRMEPKRCIRTDGKRWRCSRNVIPHHEYCEHHMAVVFPRSRNTTNNNVTTAAAAAAANKKTRIGDHHFVASTSMPLSKHPSPYSTISSPQLHEPTKPPNKTPVLVLNTHTEKCVFDSSNKQHNSRGLDGIMRGKMVTLDTSKQQNQHLIQNNNTPKTREGSSHNPSHQVHGTEPLNLVSNKDFGANASHQQNTDSPLASQMESPMETLKGFIDTWSYANAGIANNGEENTIPGNSKRDIFRSTLSLSMAIVAGNALDEKMGLGVPDSDDRDGVGGSDNSQGSSWLSPVPLVGSILGAPLFATTTSAVSFPNANSQSTMLSVSDTSGYNTSTVAVSAATSSSMAFQRLE